MRAYVSATFTDLQECRAEVRLALSRLGVVDVAMEHYVAGPHRPLDRCLRDVTDCDVYVGIFAWRYGFVPQGENRSITEQEFRAAVAAGKPVLVFLLREDAPWPRSLMDRDLSRIEALRGELAHGWLCSFFSSPQELAALVTAAVHDQLAGAGDGPAAGSSALNPAVVERYCRRIVQQYGRLDLEALTPAQYDDQLRIELRSVFVEPDVREDLPVVDLPKYLQEFLAAQENLTDEDLPNELSADELRRLRDAYKQRPRRRVLDLLRSAGAGGKVVLLGDPGAGKSSLARYIALSLADPVVLPGRLPFSGWLPLLVELKSYEAARKDQGCQTLLEFFGLLARTEGLGLGEGPLHEYLSHDGRAVAIFDGLDEIFDPAHRAAITRQIAAFAGQYPKAAVLVTSRVIGYSRATLADAGFTHATLQDLDAGQIREFLAGWYALALQDRPAHADVRSDRLLAAISESRSIAEMAGNPLLLTILAIVGQHQELPRERWKVYDYAATVLVERWDVNRHLRDERLTTDFIGEDDKKEMLRRIALAMQSGPAGGGNYLTGEQLRREFEDYLRSRYGQEPVRAAVIARAMIGQFRERNFILSRYGSELYGFVHRAFLEHFCAEAYRWQFEKDQVLSLDQLKTNVYGQRWNDPAWREILRLIAGTIREQWTGQIVAYLADDVNWPWAWRFGDAPPWNIALAVQCLAEARVHTSLDRAGQRVLIRVIQLLEHGILDEDDQASNLIESEILPALAAVGSAWPGRNVYLRWYLARGIRLAWRPVSNLAGRIAVSLFPQDPALLRTISDSIHAMSDTRLRQALIEALASYPPPADPQVRALLASLAADDDDADVRRAAVQALASLAGTDPQVRALLAGRADDDESWVVREAAVQALAELAATDPQVWALLASHAADDDDADVRRAAVQALASLAGTDPQVRVLLADRADDDENAEVREAGLQALTGLAATDPQVRAILARRAAADENADVRRAAVQALADLAATDPQVQAILVRCAADENADIRRAAVQALASLSGLSGTDPQVRDLLARRAANDEDADVRRAAVQALTSLSGLAGTDPQVRDLLARRAADDEDADVRGAAVQSLAGLAATDPQVRDLLARRAADDENAVVRRVAVQSLADLAAANTQVLALLADRADDDEDADVRRAAMQTLADLAATDARVRTLLARRAAADESWAVRRAAVQILADTAATDPRVRALLARRAADDVDAAVRRAAVQILASMAATDPQVRALLARRAADDVDAAVRRAAVQALASMAATDPQVRALLARRAADDKDADVRGSAVQALGNLAPADPHLQVMLAERANDDEHWSVRRAAVQILASTAASDPQVRALLVGDPVSIEDLRVSSADWQEILRGDKDNPLSGYINSDSARKADRRWINQLAVRVASCSANFTPDAMPAIRDNEGVLFGHVIGVS